MPGFRHHAAEARVTFEHELEMVDGLERKFFECLLAVYEPDAQKASQVNECIFLPRPLA